MELLKTVLVGVLFVLLWPVFATAQVNYVSVDLDSKQLAESSGVCTSASGQVIWTHNDSGDRPRLFAFQPNGDLLQVVELASAKAVDWEDICAFESNGSSFVAVGDIGDNGAKRDDVTIYFAKISDAEPIRAETYSECRVVFPNGPVDCEGLAFDPLTKRLLLFTKELLRCRVFSVSAEDLAKDRSVTASFEKTINIGMVTGADISRDGKWLAIVTYGPLLLLKRDASGWPRHTSEDLFQMPPRRQGESVCFSSNGKELLLTSEHLPAPLIKISLQDLISSKK